MKFKFSLLFSFFLLILLSSPTFPQPSGMRMGPGMGRGQWKGESRCWSASELNLSSEQVKELDLVQQTYNRETHLLRAQLFVKWLELREILTDPSVKIESIRSKQGELFELQHKLEEKLLDYLIKLRNLLTQEQLKSWCPEKEFPSRREMMHRHGLMGPMHPH